MTKVNVGGRESFGRFTLRVATEIISGKLHIGYREFLRSCARKKLGLSEVLDSEATKMLTRVECWLKSGETVVFKHV